MNTRFLFILPSLAVGMVLGWFLGRNTEAPTEKAEPRTLNVANPSRSQSNEVLTKTSASLPSNPAATREQRWQILRSSEHPLAGQQREGIIAEMLASGLDAATMQAAAANLAESDQETFVRETARVWLEEDPNKASHFVDTMPPGPLHKAALEELSLHWAKRDPQQATQWAWDQREHHAEAPSMAIQIWAAQDAPGASAWLAAQPATPARETLSILLIENLIQQDPAAAKSWIESLTDPATKENMLQRLGN